ncbi:MAG: YaaA family protein [bacterium]|jgi:uncharacterized protein|nr:YaaA family protein [bacterium]
MITLFSPSETKRSGGTSTFSTHQNKLIGGFDIRKALIHKYEEQLTGTVEECMKLTGWKDAEKINQLPVDLNNAPTLPALQRYTGVGYQYLDFETLEKNQQRFLESHIIIFSNLLGPLKGSDLIPETKLKQTKKLTGIDIAKHYKQHTSQKLDNLIGEQPVLDLRAGAYKTFFKPKTQTIECVFLKDGKTVNHWSKAYRGILLRAFAQYQPNTLEELSALNIKGLKLAKKEGGTLTYQIT